MDLQKEIEKYLFGFEEEGFSLVGFYQQGSHIFGLADEFSDVDFIVVWKDKYPKADSRKESAGRLGFEIHDFRDIPQVKKGLDAFVYKNQILNIAHINGDDFFNFYKDVETLDEYYKEEYMRLSGFKEGKIVYDPEKKLEKYKSEIVVTPNIISDFINFIKDELEHDLRMLMVTSKRKGIAYFLLYFSGIVNDLQILESLKEGNFPGSLKWFESRSPNSKLIPLLSEIESKIDKEKIAQEIIHISKKFGFNPSEKIKA